MSTLRDTLATLRDIWRFSRETRGLALLFLSLILLAMGTFILIAERSVLMPFIYTLF